MEIPVPTIRPFRRRDGAPAILLVRDETAPSRATWYAYAAAGGRTVEMINGGEPGSWCPPGSQALDAALEQATERDDWNEAEDDERASDSRIRMRWMAATAIGRPEAAEFLSVCGSAAARAICYAAGEATLRLLDERCGRPTVDAFFDRNSFLFHELIDRAIRKPDAIAAAILSPSPAAPLADLIAMREYGPDEATCRATMDRLLKRLGGAAMPQFLRVNQVLWLACYVPADWLPTPATCDDFGAVASMVRFLVTASKGGLSPRRLVASSKGRWSEFRQRVYAGDGSMRDAADMWQALRNQLVEPALRHHLAFGTEAATMPVAARHVRRDDFAPDSDALEAFCSRLLLSGKSLPAVAEASGRWHAAQAAMDADICEERDATWPVPFDRIDLGDGLALTAIRDSATLSAEGRDLQHCVGGYLRSCVQNDSVIASMTRLALDGTRRRSSTVELSAWSPGRPWQPEIRQHRGLKNRQADPDESAALAGFVRRLQDDPYVGAGIGQLNPGRLDLEPYGYDWTDPEALGRAFRQWSRFLPADVVARGTLGFLDHAARLAPGAGVRPAVP